MNNISQYTKFKTSRIGFLKENSPSDIVIKWGGKWKAGFKSTASNSPENVESVDSKIEKTPLNPM